MKGDLLGIHDASMALLRKVGMTFYLHEALRVLGDHGVRIKNQTAFFTENQIMDWIVKAPRVFTLHARNPEHDIRLGLGQTRYGPPYGPHLMVEKDGRVREATLKDYITMAKMLHQAPPFHINGGVLVQPHDVSPDKAAVILFYCTIVLSDKCLVTVACGPAATGMIMEMLEMMFGGKAALKARPRAILPVNTLSPLQMDGDTTHTLMTYARYGQPTMISPCVMAGTTGPVTLAGTLALSNAEILAGIVLAQMTNPGAPVVYGFQSTVADMRTGGISIGAPERALCIVYGARLAGAYGFPSRTGGCDTDAPSVSVQSGYESMMNLFAARRAKVDIVMQAAGLLAGFAAFSHHKFMADLEIIGMIERYSKGVEICEEHLALGVIEACGKNGQFITHPHTLKHFRGEVWNPEVGQRGFLDQADAGRGLDQRMERRMEEMLNTYNTPDLSQNLRTRLHDYLKAKGVNVDEIDTVLAA